MLMHRLPEKLLAISLAIILGLVPLRGAMAGIADFSPQKQGVHRLIDMQHDMIKLTADHSTGVCDQCDDEDTCIDHACSANLCTSCPVALLSSFSFSTNSVVSSAFLPGDDNLVNRHFSFLFRPPKA